MARLGREEAGRMRERPRPARPEDTRRDDTRESAASAYLMAVQQGRFSEARVALRALAGQDTDGVERARLADAFRRRADGLWSGGDTAGARPLYQLTAELDPRDAEAARRGQAHRHPIRTPPGRRPDTSSWPPPPARARTWPPAS
jgi:hypothetical protein